MQKLETTFLDFNDEYDLLIIENYPKEIYQKQLLKQKANQIGRLCNDCLMDETQRGKKQDWTFLHKGYPVNVEAARQHGFNVDYLGEKLFLNEAESYFLCKILSNHFDIPFKEFDN